MKPTKRLILYPAFRMIALPIFLSKTSISKAYLVLLFGRASPDRLMRSNSRDVTTAISSHPVHAYIWVSRFHFVKEKWARRARLDASYFQKIDRPKTLLSLFRIVHIRAVLRCRICSVLFELKATGPSRIAFIFEFLAEKVAFIQLQSTTNLLQKFLYASDLIDIDHWWLWKYSYVVLVIQEVLLAIRRSCNICYSSNNGVALRSLHDVYMSP